MKSNRGQNTFCGQAIHLKASVRGVDADPQRDLASLRQMFGEYQH